MKSSQAYHLIISVSSRKSKLFYNDLFRVLKWKRVYEDAQAAGYSDGSFTFWIVPSEKGREKKHQFKSVGFHHFSIRVPRQQDVDKMYVWCKRKKVEVVEAPTVYPQYNKNYYAVFFLDPDGLKLEVTFV